jgi:Uma2 family endonuclease
VEASSSVRNEFYDGQIFAMAGASLPHNDITANLISIIRRVMRARGCRVFGSDLRVQTPGGLFTYPDVSVVCGEPLLVQGRPDTLVNPIVLIDVLSDATREYDRTQKFSLYQEIPTLREFILVEQSAVLVESYRWQAGRWAPDRLDGIDGVLKVAALALDMPLREIYRDVFG